MQNRAIKYRIYPSAEQKVLFAKTFGCCRKIWNLMLADKITYYQQTQKMLQTTPAQYKKSYPYLKEVDSLALAEAKTKEMQKVLTNLKAEKALVITADNDQNVVLSARNIADVETATPATINTYDVMKHNTVVVTKDAVASIEEVYA